MAVTMIEGFDNSGTTTLLTLKGWNNSSSGGSVSLVAGRITGQALRAISGSNNNNRGGMYKFFTPATTVVVGFAFRSQNFSGNAIAPIADLLTGAFAAVLEIGFTSGNKIRLQTAAGATIADGSTVILPNVWYFLEIKVVINGASGSVAARLNGASEIATTTVNLGSTALGCLQLYVPYGPTGGNWANLGDLSYDDIYILDTTGTDNIDYLGDVRVITRYPSADGASSAWTPSTGTNRSAMIDESSGTWPNDDTDYISDNVPGDRDTHDYQAMSVAGPVKAVQTNLYARKDDAAIRQICSTIRSNASYFDGATKTLAGSYVFYSDIWENDPQDSGDWTITRIDAAEFGVKTVT